MHNIGCRRQPVFAALLLLSHDEFADDGAEKTVLYFVVNNWGSGPNPTGLRVEFSAVPYKPISAGWDPHL